MAQYLKWHRTVKIKGKKTSIKLSERSSERNNMKYNEIKTFCTEGLRNCTFNRKKEMSRKEEIFNSNIRSEIEIYDAIKFQFFWSYTR